MSEVILKIEEILEGERWNSVAGYAITTDKQVIKLIIDNESNCCESWGYFLSEDDTERFVGSLLIDVTLTDTALHTHQLAENNCEPGDLDAGDTMFVNILTTMGLLQFVAYNTHNGYYGHQAKVISEQLNHSENL